ncbi:hypothetical protein BT93_G1432 [Corymbia citriodora subsp. variegata]|nr:hypothetical protein BT93_G1432 [Corymbia citriodora subsp. variegata]
MLIQIYFTSSINCFSPLEPKRLFILSLLLLSASVHFSSALLSPPSLSALPAHLSLRRRGVRTLARQRRGRGPVLTKPPWITSAARCCCSVSSALPPPEPPPRAHPPLPPPRAPSPSQSDQSGADKIMSVQNMVLGSLALGWALMGLLL